MVVLGCAVDIMLLCVLALIFQRLMNLSTPQDLMSPKCENIFDLRLIILNLSICCIGLCYRCNDSVGFGLMALSLGLEGPWTP